MRSQGFVDQYCASCFSLVVGQYVTGVIAPGTSLYVPMRTRTGLFSINEGGKITTTLTDFSLVVL